MSNKITRRVALSSIAGGLASAALVLRVLKGKYETAMPHGDHSVNEFDQYYKTVGPPMLRKPDLESDTKEWDHYVSAASCPIKTISGPSSFTLGHKPQEAFDFRVLGVYAAYDGKFRHAKYPQLPSWYAITKGRVTITKPVEDDKPALLIRAEKEMTKAPYYQQEMPGGECIIVSDAGKRNYYEVVGGTQRKRDECDINIPCVKLAGRLTFFYPKNRTFARGTKWVNPKTGNFDSDLSCEVVDFAEIAGRKAVKIAAKKQSSYEPTFAVAVVDATQKLTKKQLQKESQRLVEKAQNAQPAKSLIEKVHVTVYLDLTTGIVLRQESTIVDQGLTATAITQVLDG